MLRRILPLGTCLAVLLIWGCSDNSQIAGPGNPGTLVPLVERPAFIDNRPELARRAAIRSGEDELRRGRKTPPAPVIDTTVDPNPRPAHKWAFVVGISDYVGTANDLEYCDDDAKEIRKYLEGQGFQVRLCLDAQATSMAIDSGLDWLASVAGPGDEIAFFYSGHATKLAGFGSSLISTDMFYITHTRVMEKLAVANCTKKLVGIDACQVGDFQGDAEEGMFIALALDNTYSYDAPSLRNGAWTYYFLFGAVNQALGFAEDIAVFAENGMDSWAKSNELSSSPVHMDRYVGKFDI